MSVLCETFGKRKSNTLFWKGVTQTLVLGTFMLEGLVDEHLSVNYANFQNNIQEQL
jgi:hypothetical protein